MKLFVGIPTRGDITALTLESIDAEVAAWDSVIDLVQPYQYERGRATALRKTGWPKRSWQVMRMCS